MLPKYLEIKSHLQMQFNVKGYSECIVCLAEKATEKEDI